MAPKLVASRTALPPKGALPCLGRPGAAAMAPKLVASRTALPPKGALPCLGRPGAAAMAPKLVASRTAQKRPPNGFTLVELLVALGILALVAILSWRGLDGMMRAQAMTQQRSDQVVTLQSALAQWTTDLNSVVQVSTLRPLDWDGQVLRMTRRHLTSPAEGLLVVGWSTRLINGQTQWLRWQSPPVRNLGDLQAAWARAASWARTPSAEDQGREVLINPISDWQIFYFRGNAWSSPFSSAGTGSPGLTAGTTDVSMPDGVRLVVDLPPDHPLAGKLTLDWVRPTLSGGKN